MIIYNYAMDVLVSLIEDRSDTSLSIVSFVSHGDHDANQRMSLDGPGFLEPKSTEKSVHHHVHQPQNVTIGKKQQKSYPHLLFFVESQPRQDSPCTLRCLLYTSPSPRDQA
eukprot:TRINITY_DN2367_c0_g1_i2.p4 TRINITY_DN2367_c0_g1~~TRINITY_DN2367_c0_g1_i2.p4  ORF type:complete len:111 (-),score=4.06 TRINITY_DN2367_c0_g1_i2:62-394(-)